MFDSYIKSFKEILQKDSLKGCIAMTLGLCFHFFGYECSRAASITLLAAKDVGLGNEAIPLTIALGSPASGMVLYLYSKSIKKYGSKLTLRVSNIMCVLIMGIIALYCASFKGLSGKVAVVFFYAFREIYVSLLSSQYWAYIAGTLDRSTSSYIVTFSGIVSVASAVGGVSVEQLVAYGGVRWLLISAVISTAGSFTCSEIALALCYDSSRHMAKRGGDGGGIRGRSSVTATSSPCNNQKDRKVDGKQHCDRSEIEEECKGTNEQSANQEACSNSHDGKNDKPLEEETEQNTVANSGHHRHHHSSKKREGFWIDSFNLIIKHKLLQILFVEAITHQLCGNMLNLMFHNGLRSEIADNSERAMLVGRFFATVNVAACTLQCFAIPKILSQGTLPSVLTKIPFIVLIAVALGIIKPGLITVMLGFGTIKVLEYSIMHSASEMIYLPTGNDVRYLGKELIRFFGHKLGKSGASLVLSGLVSQFNPSICAQSIWGSILTLCWGASMYRLSEHLRERDNIEQHIKINKEIINENNKDTKTTSSSNESKHNQEIVLSNPITLLISEKNDETSEESRSCDNNNNNNSIEDDYDSSIYQSSDTLGTLDSNTYDDYDNTEETDLFNNDTNSYSIGLNIDGDEDESYNNDNNNNKLIIKKPKKIRKIKKNDQSPLVMLRIDSTQVSLNTINHNNNGFRYRKRKNE